MQWLFLRMSESSACPRGLGFRGLGLRAGLSALSLHNLSDLEELIASFVRVLYLKDHGTYNPQLRYL